MAHTTLTVTAEDLQTLSAGFAAAFQKKPDRFFSAPGRTEIGGNHTDHQRGRVLAAAVNLDTRAAVALNGTREIRLRSQDYPLCVVSLDELEPNEGEFNTTTALIRGVTAWFVQRGCVVQGFDAYVMSTVLPGSGLSSSAAFEVLVGNILNTLFFDDRLSAVDIAIASQYAENVFFGKPCGLMDQMASSVGNLVAIDFFDKENPDVKRVDFDFSTAGHALCIVDTRASHADLTDDYAAIPQEMKKIADFFGCSVLSEITEEAFYQALPELRSICGDRAVLRAVHFYQDNARVEKQVSALENGDFETFLRLVGESGRSSYMYLQNVIPQNADVHQDVAAALALCEHLLNGRGAFRVHGGGFAGTVQAFVPTDMLEDFRTGIDRVLGDGACHVLSIRAEGGCELVTL